MREDTFSKLYLYCLSICLLLTACSDSSVSSRPTLSVSVPPQKYILSQLVDSLYDINVIIPENADPETYDPSMRTLAAIGKSKALFFVGAGGFEDPVVASVKSNFAHLPVFDTSRGLNLIRDTHHGETADPHVWSSVRTVKNMADNMLASLIKLDPAHAPRFRKNHQKLTQSLDSLDSAIASLLQSKNKSFAIWHPALSYFARDYNLTQLPLEEEGKEASPAQFRHRLDIIKNSDANVIFSDALHGDRREQTVAKWTGLKLVKFNLSSEKWPEEMIKLAQSL
ncbi:MAG: zinc ABC transporter substrate-binding protein [Prevotella sp.]|nr:zinc ABC transporter substrate-binding protein [Prevotella sp.]